MNEEEEIANSRDCEQVYDAPKRQPAARKQQQHVGKKDGGGGSLWDSLSWGGPAKAINASRRKNSKDDQNLNKLELECDEAYDKFGEVVAQQHSKSDDKGAYSYTTTEDEDEEDDDGAGSMAREAVATVVALRKANNQRTAR